MSATTRNRPSRAWLLSTAMGHPRWLAGTLGDDRVKKLCTNGICDSSRNRCGLPSRHDPFRGLVQHDAGVGDEEDARQLVRHDDDGDAKVAAERDDQLIELHRRNRIETGGRLVEEQEIGLEHHGAGDAGALLHAAGNLARQMVGERTEPDEFELGLTELADGGARGSASTSSAAARDSRRASAS